MGQRNIDLVLNQFPCRIEAAANEFLMAEVTMEEVKIVVFQLEASKARGLEGLNGLFFQSH